LPERRPELTGRRSDSDKLIKVRYWQ
jgi:hypothetical protein